MTDTPKPLSSRRTRDKFLPNIKQLEEAAKELPDPELWPDPSYRVLVVVKDQQQEIKFVRKQISRGDNLSPRWVYEGKVLIRKRDA